MPLTYVNDGLRAAMIFGNFEQALFNTALIVVLEAVCIIVGAAVTKWKRSSVLFALIFVNFSNNC